tara:strand:+ start:521 stop:655 length:135 start_codon:yes stop_codon:yes gene_type:complete
MKKSILTSAAELKKHFDKLDKAEPKIFPRYILANMVRLCKGSKS